MTPYADRKNHPNDGVHLPHHILYQTCCEAVALLDAKG